MCFAPVTHLKCISVYLEDCSGTSSFKTASQTKSAPLANPAADSSTVEALPILSCIKYSLSSSFIFCLFYPWHIILFLRMHDSEPQKEDGAIMTEDHHCLYSSICRTAFHGLVYIHHSEMGRFSLFSALSSSTTVYTVCKQRRRLA